LANPSPIQCSQCSGGSSSDALECAKCGGRIVRICGTCGFKNSAAKGFCDVCGEEMTAGTAGQIVPKQQIDAVHQDNLKGMSPPAETSPEPPPPPPEPPKRPEPPAPRIPEPEPPPRLPPIGRMDPEPEPPRTPEPPSEPEPAPEPPPEPEIPTVQTPAKPNPRRDLEDFLPRTGVQRILRNDELKEEQPKEPLSLKTPDPAPRPGEPPRTQLRRIPDSERKPESRKEERRPEPPKRPEPKVPEERPREKRPEAAAKKPSRHPEREKLKPLSKDDLAFTQRTIRRVKERPGASTAILLVLLLVSGGLYGLLWKQRNTPSRKLTKAAGEYLFALKEKNFGAAYEALSAESKASLSADRFTELQEKGDWSFDDLEIKSLTEKWGFITYKLYGSNASGEDWMHFVLENGLWKRAYWWHLMTPIEEALARRDFQAALKYANEAAELNPRDPLVNSYLCEAAYGLGRWDAALKVCRRTFQAADKFNSRLEPKDVFHLHSLVADIYRNKLGRLSEAVGEYNIMLAFPLLDADSRCDTMLARADAHQLLKEYAEAVPDYEEAGKHCRNLHDQAYAERGVKILSGLGGEEAIQRLKSHKMPGDENTLFAWRRKVRENLARELKAAVEDLAFQETWTAEHLAGPVYKVTVTDRSTPILSGEVNLLDHSIKVNIHVR